uniref:Energy-converting hydrogenase A subunit D n=1 Tax=Methanococcus maripaludis (strain C6 / ATCC BAA-1332) TaxID=444158 RepID=A9A9L2_METM6
MEILPIVAAGCCILGGIGTIIHTHNINKIIMFALLESGLIGLIASFYYLDVAIISSVLEPVATLILLLGVLKYEFTIRNKKKYSTEVPVLTK